MKKTQLIALLVIGIVAGMVLGTVLTTVLANPGYTPIEIRVPREGQEVNKNEHLVIVTERLSHVYGTGPAKITVTIKLTGRMPEVVARGSVNVNLVKYYDDDQDDTDDD
jgi:hypothetical protein